jgi:hypothetical protein
MWLCRTLLCLGVVIGLPSVWETLAFSWNPDFQAPRLPLGPTHTNYHAFREFTLTMGVELVILYIVFQPLGHRIRPLWNVMLIAALGYYVGWWLPWPIFGYHAPNELSQIDHFTATVVTLAGVFCARQQFSKTPMTRDEYTEQKPTKRTNI